GLSANNILAQRSDAELSYELLLTRAGHILKSPQRGRETMLEFKQDWANLQRASARNSVTLANNFASGESSRGAAASAHGPQGMLSRRHSERSPRSEESLLRVLFFGFFFEVFLRFTRRYSAFPDGAFLSCTGGSFSRIICSTRFQTAGSHSISV